MPPARVLDLNADLGESYGAWVLGDDEALLPLLSSANVACGFHAGDPLTLRRTVSAAARLGVAVGAQVSYPDVVGFGRREIAVPADELEADVLYQLSALDGLCRTAGTRVRYLKPHGALYHRTRTDPVQAGAVVAAVVAYGSDGRLVPRGQPGAVLRDPTAAAEQALVLVAVDSVGSLCGHADTPAAVAMAQAIRAGLEAAGVIIRAFV